MIVPPVLDHLVIDVGDGIDDAAAIFGALGFTLTPRGHHSLGSVNHLAMFEETYLELMGYGPTGAGPLGDGARADLARFPIGLNGLVFRPEDADAAFTQAAVAGLAPEPPSDLTRPVTIDGVTRDAAFRLVRLPRVSAALGRVYFCEHRTPELVWRPPWQVHRNGAQDIAFVWIAARDPDAAALPYAALFGRDALIRVADGWAMRAGAAKLCFLEAGALAARLGPLTPDVSGRRDYMAAIGLRSAETRPPVPAREACNTALLFVAPDEEI